MGGAPSELSPSGAVSALAIETRAVEVAEKHKLEAYHESLEEPEGEAEEDGEHGEEGHPPPMTAEQHREAKRVINSFVKEMVKGRRMNVVTKDGGIRVVNVYLSRRLDALSIQAAGN